MKPTKKDKDFDKLRKPIKVYQKEKKEKKKTNQRKQIDWFKWSEERESHTVAVNTRKVVNNKSIAFKAIFRKRREENVKATSHLILFQGRTICGINSAQKWREKSLQLAFYSIKQCVPAWASPNHWDTSYGYMSWNSVFLFSFFFLGRNWCPEVWLN